MVRGKRELVEAVEVNVKWLIVGSKGQLGKTFCQVLDSSGIEFCELSREHGNICDQEFVDNYISFLSPDVIVNAAAWTDVDGAELNESSANLINADVPGFLAMTAQKLGSVLIHVSTDYVFSGSGNVPWSESDIKRPMSAYGRSKAKGENAVLALYPEKSYIFRTSWLYSKFGTNFAKTMTILALKNDNQLRVVSDQIGQPTSATDLALQIMHSVNESIPFGIYHATNSGQASWFEFAQEIFKECGSDINRISQVTSLEYASIANRPAFSVLGQSAWARTRLSPMRHWKLALQEHMPEILDTVRMKG
jgi:dTDP-4-dehydrorhamnose reductase